MTVSTRTDRLKKDVWILDGALQPDAAEQYRRACAHLFDITLLVPEDQFYNRLQGYNLDRAVFGRCKGVPQRFERTHAHILADGSDTLQLIVDIGGEWSGSYGAREVDWRMGPIRIIDMARPFAIHTGVYHTYNLIFPRSAIGEKGALDLHGLVIPESDAGGQLLVSYIETLWANIERLTPTQASAAIDAMFALISGLVTVHAPEADNDTRPFRKVQLASACSFVHAHLGDFELSPERVREHLGISRSQLYEVFEPVGGVASFIQTRRLDHAFDAIIADRTEPGTLAEIGYAHGFRSDTHFNRAFRARFGLPPGKLRALRASAQAHELSVVNRPDDVWAWFRNL
jgi:AraC-like DNA-binding protein